MVYLLVCGLHCGHEYHPHSVGWLDVEEGKLKCPSWATKKVNSQVQRGRMSKEVRAMDRWGTESHICREPRPARGREKSISGSEVEEPK
jgi:hypothetical protein